jgi:hypothetical protein
MKVLLASSPSDDIKRFWPGVNERECLFQDHIVACATSTDDHNTTESGESGADIWLYSRQVLRLLSESLHIACGTDNSISD